MSPKKVLILFAHPLFEKSRVHAAMVHHIPRVVGVTFHDLYEFYPDFNINIKHEQELLSQHDIIILQHPMYWYSVPPIIKQWIDMVLEYGWAYGKGGTALQGKWIMQALSAGGPQEAYTLEGRHQRTLRQFLAPLEQTAKLCNLTYLPPYVLHGTHRATEEQIEEHAIQYGKLITHLISGTATLEEFAEKEYANLTPVAHGR